VTAPAGLADEIAAALREGFLRYQRLELAPAAAEGGPVPGHEYRQTRSHERYYSPEELQLVVQGSAEAGLLPSEARGLVSGIFEFGERTASEVMVPRVRVTALRVGVSPGEVEEVLRRWPKAGTQSTSTMSIRLSVSCMSRISCG
jgi:hypothetical protein